MKNKILILLMSCNKDLYESEEQACRETFLMDAEKAGIQYYFYKGINDEHQLELVDNETHTMYLSVPDGLGGTSRKTVAALSEALKMDNWDYVLKTNVSTWLDIKKIVKAVDSWEGKEDKNIYGARYLANDASKSVPFPRGYFTILSRSLVEGIVEWAPKLMNVDEFPKTDDTLICLALLYYLQKINGIKYLEQLKEVPSVTIWSDDIQETSEWSDALSIRCKSEPVISDTSNNMRKVHELKHAKKVDRKFFRAMGPLETKYGFMPYINFQSLSKILAEKANKTEAYTNDAGVVKRTEPKNKLEEIRRKLRGEK